MGRSVTYEELGRKKLRAIKLGSRTLIDVKHGLAYLASKPAAEINTGRTRRPPVMMSPLRERQTEAEALVSEIGSSGRRRSYQLGQGPSAATTIGKAAAPADR